MIRVVLVVLEWAAYAITAIAIGSVLRIPMPDQQVRPAASPNQSSASLQEKGGAPNRDRSP